MESVRVAGEALGKDEVEALPRGVFDEHALECFDSEATSGSSKVVKHTSRSSDSVTHAQFRKLLDFVRDKLAELGNAVLDGQIAISPYRMGKQTPCGWCDYRAVCRMDPLINDYRRVITGRREKMLEHIMGES
jgi:ATP-dependent helicase/nuclease subunit B